MQTIKLVKKYWLPLLLFLLILTGLLMKFLLPPVTVSPVLVPRITPSPTYAPISSPEINTGLTPVDQIIWAIDSLDLPSTIPYLTASTPDINPATYQPLATSLGINGKPNKIAGQPLIIFSSSDNSADFYVNLKDKVAQYQLNLENQSLPSSGATLSPTDLTQKLITQLSSSLPLPAGIAYVPAGSDYQTISGERFVSVPRSQATLIQITLHYQYQSRPLTYLGQPAVYAVYSLSGTLVKLRLALPFSSFSLSSSYSVKNFTDLKQSPSADFVLLSVNGNQTFTLSDQDEVIKTATVTGGYLGYLYSPTSSAVLPYIFLTGTAQSKISGTLNLTLATPAFKSSSESK